MREYFSPAVSKRIKLFPRAEDGILPLNSMAKIREISLLVLVLLLTVGNGWAGWAKQKVNTLAWLNSVYFSDDKRGWIAGSAGTLLVTEDGGASWKKTKVPTLDVIRRVYFSDADTGWLLCERKREQSSGMSAPSYLLKTTNGGFNWDKIEIGGSGSPLLAGLFFAKDGRGWAVGEAGAVFTQEDAGWKKLQQPTLFAVFDGGFFDDERGILTGGGGSIMFTENGGVTWSRATVSGSPTTKFNAVSLPDAKTGWAVGSEGKIFHTTNGGKFWRPQESFVKKDLLDVAFLNGQEGWVVGADGALLQTFSGGRVWKTVNTGVVHRLESVFFRDRNSGWAVGFGGTVLRYDTRR